MRRKQTWTKQFGNGSFCTQLLVISSFPNYLLIRSFETAKSHDKPRPNKFQNASGPLHNNTCIKKLANDGKRLAFVTGPRRIEEFRENRAESVA